ncbi:glutamate--cysteine ligase [Georgenia sp. AZ-5]|uniref:carboxylate-amine ligase n=1 Tax=Georgenia sp. AZ-5 TaxID=3367526 RepID=UPI003754775B
MRTVGVEEELLLVERGTGQAMAVAEAALAQARAWGTATLPGGGPGGVLTHEMAEQQLETNTRPHTSMLELEEELRDWRLRAARAAASVGAEVAALGTYPAEVEPQVVGSPRYEEMVRRYGLTGRQHLTCGLHVHVRIDSHEEAVAVLDRIRVWLPVVQALTVNSPFWQGLSTGYASFRSQLMLRWPSAGPTEVFGSAAAYDDLVAQMIASGVLLDRGMLYFDARASEHFPTVEIRSADVCLHAEDAVLVAALCRALVETAASSWAGGAPPPPVPATTLRLAMWQAAREGLDGVLVDPVTVRPRPAAEVVRALLAHVRPALRAAGDAALVEERLDVLLRRGTGARRQREVYARGAGLAAVVSDAARLTAGADAAAWPAEA